MILIEFVFIYEWRRQTIYNVSSPYTPIGLFFFFCLLHLVYLWLLIADARFALSPDLISLRGVYLARYSMGKHSKNLYIYQEAGVHQKEFTINSRISRGQLCAKVVLEALSSLGKQIS